MPKSKHHWNYRTIRHKDGDGYYFEIVEMHYDEHGKPRAYGSAKVGGNSPDEIMGVLEMMHISTGQPILDAITFEEILWGVMADTPIPKSGRGIFETNKT